MSDIETFWTDDTPIGEVQPGVVPMTANDVIHRAIEQVGRDVWADRDEVVKAARELYGLHLAGVRFDSALGDVVLGGLFEAVKKVSPSLTHTGLATGIFTSPKPISVDDVVGILGPDRTPSEWERLLGVTVLDPDGWDRRNFEEDWARPISRAEFDEKAALSTVRRGGAS